MKAITAIPLAVCLLALSPPASAQSAVPPRGFVTFDVGGQPATTTFSEPLATTVYLETESVNPAYRVGSGVMFDVGTGFRVKRNFGVGLTISSFQRKDAATIDALIPHPFFYGMMRPAAGDASGLKRREIAAHIQAIAFLPTGRRWSVALSGGPSYFSVEQDLVTGISFHETYPYDAATFAGASVEARTKSAWGGNIGSDATYRLARHVGIGGALRYAHASVALPVANARGNTKADAGNVQIGVGLRLLF